MVEDQIKEIETQMEQMAIRKEQMKELCRRKDKDVFDVVYNVSDELKDVDPSLDERLKEKAVDGKRTDLDPTKTPLQKEENYTNLMLEIERLYSRAFALMLENIKSLRNQESQRNDSVAKTLKEAVTSVENSKNLETSAPEAPEPEVEQEKRRGLFGGKKEPKGKKATATVERVSLEDLNNEKNQMESENNNSQEEERYRAYNERVKNRASSKEQSYESAGMQQERVMERPGPSFGSKDNKD